MRKLTLTLLLAAPSSYAYHHMCINLKAGAGYSGKVRVSDGQGFNANGPAWSASCWMPEMVY